MMPGDLVEVRSAAEILSTLDKNGTLENLPFMPEMLAFCGKQFRVSRRAFKTCVDDGDIRQLDDTVFLEEMRFDGTLHAGCDRGCLIFWKTAWLKPAGAASLNGNSSRSRVSEADLWSLAQRDGQFFCQSSEIVNAPKLLPWWEAKQYLWDLKYNRLPFLLFARILFIAIYNKSASLLNFPAWGAVSGVATAGNGSQPLNLRQRKIKHTMLLGSATCDGVCHGLCPRESLFSGASAGWRELRRPNTGARILRIK